MRSHSYINSAKKILNEYDGSMPFAVWVKQFFKSHKKYGSRDRKEIIHLCYSFFRLGNAFSTESFEQRILLGVFLSTAATNFVLKELKPEWNNKLPLSLEEKFQFLNKNEEVFYVFPFAGQLSSSIDEKMFHESFLYQPFLYLRLRPANEDNVINKLQKAGIAFEVIDKNCVALNVSTKVNEVIEIDGEAVVQDLNSQRVVELLPVEFGNQKKPEAWDCCAASGGKSILLYDVFPQVQLTVSDVRESILRNLHSRFKAAGIKSYNSFVTDVSDANFSLSQKFNLVVCDAPCSGSGTWSRTPEQLLFFNKEKIEYYAHLQKNIAVNAAKSVIEKGYLLYITCSVFNKENEEVVEFIQQHTPLELIRSKYFMGYNKRADTLFGALFTL